MAIAGARGRRHHAGHEVLLSRATATFYGRRVQVPARRAATASSICATRIEQSCNVYFYNVGDTTRRSTRIHKYAAKLGLVGQDRHRPAGRESKPRAVDRVEAARRSSSRGTRARRSRSSIGQGAVSVTPLALATMIATVANGGTLVTPHLVTAVDDGDGKGWKPCRRRRRARSCTITPDASAGRARRPVAGRQRRRHRRPRADRRPGRRRQDRHGAGDLAQNKALRRRQDGRRATTAGSCSSRRATTRRSPASSSPSTACTAPTAAPIAKHVLETFFAKQEGRPLPVLPQRRRRAAGAGAAPHRDAAGRPANRPQRRGAREPPDRAADDRRTPPVRAPRLAAGRARSSR